MSGEHAPTPRSIARLPCPIPPIANENTASYLRRLATANHLAPDDVARLVDNPVRTVAVSPSALAMLTGRSVAVLLAALPELVDPQTGRRSPVDLRCYRTQVLCRRCARRHPHGLDAQVWTPAERHVCLRHQLWTGAGVAEAAQQVSVVGHPDILHGAVRHRRLARRFGRLVTSGAYTCAKDLWATVTWRGFMQPYDDIRQLSATASTDRRPWRMRDGDPTYQAGNYPETVTLAAMIANPYWRRHALADDNAGPATFHAEFVRRLAPTFIGEPPPLLNLRTIVLNDAKRHGWLPAPTFEDIECPSDPNPDSDHKHTTATARPVAATSGYQSV